MLSPERSKYIIKGLESNAAPLLSQVRITHPDSDHARLLQQQRGRVNADVTTRPTQAQCLTLFVPTPHLSLPRFSSTPRRDALVKVKLQSLRCCNYA